MGLLIRISNLTIYKKMYKFIMKLYFSLEDLKKPE